MTAQAAFRKAKHCIHQAEQLMKPHLDPYLYAQTFEDLNYLIHTLDELARSGPIQPLPPEELTHERRD